MILSFFFKSDTAPSEIAGKLKDWCIVLGAFAVVPGHWERRISPTQSSVPTLVILREDDRAPLVIPAGERPPAEIRSGP